MNRPQFIPNIGYLAATLLQLFILLFPAICRETPPKKVLVLHSYHPGYEWTGDIMSGIRDAGLPAEFYVEYMDSRRHASEEYLSRLIAMYQVKYGALPMDAILASDDYAVRFLLRNGPLLFPGVPIVFCGVNRYGGAGQYVTANLKNHQSMTGVIETIDLEETARLALRLHPQTKFIYLIGEGDQEQYDRNLTRTFPQLTVKRIRTQRLSFEQIEKELEHLPADSVVLLSSFSRDAANRQVTMAESAEFVCRRSTAPVYGLSKKTLGHGIVGGKLNDGYSQGSAAAHLVQAILNGATPSSLPVKTESVNPYMFDYAQLQRWGIPETALPAGSEVIGKRQSVYQQYRRIIWGVLGFLAAQAIVIFSLIANRMKRVRSERALHQSQQDLAQKVRDFESLLQVIPVGIAIAEDPDCRQMRMNRALAEQLGLEKDHNPSKTQDGEERLPFRVLQDGMEIPPTELPMQIAARERRDVCDFELTIIREDGRSFHEYGHATPLVDESGEVRGSIGVFVDLTERKKAEEALRESESRFRQLADSMPQIVWAARPDGRIDYYNRRWYEFTGFPENKNGKNNWGPVLHPDDAEKCLDVWRSAVESRQTYQIEYRFWDRKSQRYRWHLGRALPVVDRDDQVIRWFGTCTDIDEQKRTEESLRNANSDLEQFAFSASHDLQEPLRNILLYSQILQRRYQGKFDEDANQNLHFIAEGALRMRSLLSGVLEYTQVAGASTAEGAAVDSNGVLQSALANLQQHIEETGAAVTCDLLPAVYIPRIHLVQLFQNLISNALKYRKTERPTVHISAAINGTFATFSVRDNGIGIASEYYDRIFGIFKRLHTREHYAGAGIGLSICQKIVERQGGRIWVESEPGEGSNFRFTLPHGSASEISQVAS